MFYSHRQNAKISVNNYFTLTVVTLYLSLFGCSHGVFFFGDKPPVFLSEPNIDMDPNLNTPLAGLLTLTTDVPTRVSLQISSGDKQWTVDFKEMNTYHALPVTGFRPDRSHKVIVSIINRHGTRSKFAKALTVDTGPLPQGFPNIALENSKPNMMEPGYTLFNVVPEGHNAEFGAVVVIVDQSGQVVWYQIGPQYVDVRQASNGNLQFLQGNKYIEMDLLGNPVRVWKAIGKHTVKISEIPVTTPSFHHELFPMQNGNFLVVSIEARKFKNYPTSTTNPNAPTKTAIVSGDVIVEFAPDGTIVHRWPLFELLDPYRVAFGSLGNYWGGFFRKKTRDWSHGNAVIHDPKDDSVIVSLRHQDAVIKFSRKTGKLIWILGTHANWNKQRFGKYLLNPVNKQKFFFPFHQHAPMVLPNGNIMLYDNGNFRYSPFEPQPPVFKNFSRAVEYKIDEEKKTVELVWEYGQHTDTTYYSGALGDADLLPVTGNVLITHGDLPNHEKKLAARIIEVTHTTPAVEVFNLHIYDTSSDPKNGWRVYRSERIPDLYPQT